MKIRRGHLILNATALRVIFHTYALVLATINLCTKVEVPIIIRSGVKMGPVI